MPLSQKGKDKHIYSSVCLFVSDVKDEPAWTKLRRENAEVVIDFISHLNEMYQPNGLTIENLLSFKKTPSGYIT
jgi:hypothetical protein